MDNDTKNILAKAGFANPEEVTDCIRNIQIKATLRDIEAKQRDNKAVTYRPYELEHRPSVTASNEGYSPEANGCVHHRNILPKDDY